MRFWPERLSVDPEAPPPRGRGDTWVLWVGIGLATLLAAWSRAAMCTRGLPYLVHWDEYAVAGVAFDMVRDRTLDTRFYGYGGLLPTLMAVAQAAWALWARTLAETDPDHLAHFSEAVKGAADSTGDPTSHPGLYLASRLVVAAFGVATVPVTGLLAARFGGAWAGVLGAFFLAGAPPHLYHSSFAVHDVPMTFFVAVVGLATVSWAEGGRGLGIALVATACAASGKVTGVLVGVLPFVTVLLGLTRFGPRRPTRREILALFLLPAIGWLLLNPFIPFRIPEIRHALEVEAAYYYREGAPGFAADPGWGTFTRHLTGYHEGFGFHKGLLVLLGLAGLLFHRRGWLLWLVPAVLTTFFSWTTATYHRNVLPAYPFLVAGAAWGAVVVPRLLQAWWGPRVGVLAAGYWAYAVSRLAWLDVSEMELEVEDVTRPAPRSVVMAALGGTPARVGVPTELRVHPLDLARLPAATRGPLAELACDPAVDAVVVPAGFRSGRDPGRATWLSGLLPPAPGAPFPLDEPSVREPLRVVARSALLAPCDGALDLTSLPNPASFPRDAGGVHLLWNGPLPLPAGPLPAGRWEIAWDVRGTPAGGVAPRVRLEAPGGVEERDVTPIPSTLRLVVASDGTLDRGALGIRFLNDAEIGGEDRNVDVLAIRVRALP